MEETKTAEEILSQQYFSDQFEELFNKNGILKAMEEYKNQELTQQQSAYAELKKQNDNLLKDCETSVNLRLKSEEENAKMFLEIEVMKKQNEEHLKSHQLDVDFLKSWIKRFDHLTGFEVMVTEMRDTLREKKRLLKNTPPKN